MSGTRLFVVDAQAVSIRASDGQMKLTKVGPRLGPESGTIAAINRGYEIVHEGPVDDYECLIAVPGEGNPDCQYYLANMEVM